MNKFGQPWDVATFTSDPRLPAVAACPHRGSVLPVSRQPECGCAELTECRAGRGQQPGAVTLAECLECVDDDPPRRREEREEEIPEGRERER